MVHGPFRLGLSTEALTKVALSTEALAKVGLSTEALAKVGLSTEALAKVGLSTEALAKAGLSTEALAKVGKAFAYNKENYEHMKQYASLWLCALALATTLSSCEVIGGIFKAGFWSAIIVVVVVVGLILWLVGRSRK